MIPQDFIQSLLGRVEIVDVIDRYVKLKKAGTNYKACCPFHNEKTPSFNVSSTKQFYHCFGCGVHGNAIGFLMEYSGLSYPDAIRELAESLGLQVPDVRTEQARHVAVAVKSLGDRMMEALNFYRAELKKSPAAIDYLKRRGLSGEIAARYGMGYAPEGWQNLKAIYTDYEAPALKDTGLVIDSEPGEGEAKKSRRYDRFRDRVMFPILDARGHVIGFGGRVIGDGEPKYLNSPETPLFEKGRELYGLYQAKRAIRDANTVIVVEGYMDVVALAQSGVENAVATLGTATTPVHVAKLLRLADNVVFCFDGDAAGRKAAWRALEVSLPVLVDGKAVSFLFLPAEDDPDTFVRRLGKEAFLTEVARAKPLSQFLFAELVAKVDMATEEGRARFLANARPLVSQIEAPALALMIRGRLAETARLGRDEIDHLLPLKEAPRNRQVAPERTVRRAASEEAQILARVLRDLTLAVLVPAEVIPTGSPEGGALRAVVAFCASQSGPPNLGKVRAYFEEGGHLPAIETALSDAVLAQFEDDDLDLRSEVLGLVARLSDKCDSRRLAELNALFAEGRMTREQEVEHRLLSTRQATSKGGNLSSDSRSKL